MKKTIALCVIFLFGFAAICFGQADKDKPKEILEKVEPVVDGLLDAYNQGDYERMAKDFSEKMSKALPVEELEKFGEKNLKPQCGDYVKGTKSFHGVQYKDDSVVVQYLAKFTKAKVIVTVSFKKDDPKTRLEGLWFKPAPEELGEAQAAAFLDKARPVADNLLDALIKKDYERARRDFSGEMNKALSAEKLKESLEQEEPKYGAMKSCTFDRVIKEGESQSLMYKCAFEKVDDMNYKVVFKLDDKDFKVQGLWLKP